MFGVKFNVYGWGQFGKTIKEAEKKFYSQYQKRKKDFLNSLNKMALKGGFIILNDPKINIVKKIDFSSKNPYAIWLYAQIIIEDTNNEGRKKFMQKVNKTGLLNLEIENYTGYIKIK